MTRNCPTGIVLHPRFTICRQEPRDGSGREYRDGTHPGQDPERCPPEAGATAPARERLRIFPVAFNPGLRRRANVQIWRQGESPAHPATTHLPAQASFGAPNLRCLDEDSIGMAVSLLFPISEQFSPVRGVPRGSTASRPELGREAVMPCAYVRIKFDTNSRRPQTG